MSWGSAGSGIDLRLALVLPALVVISCFAPLLGLSLRSLSPWVSAALLVTVAIAVCFLLLRHRGTLRALVLSAASVIAGTGCLLLVSLGLRTLADSGRDGIANGAVTVLPLLLIAFAALCVAASFYAVREHRGVLGSAWLLAFAAPFVLATPISRLSDAAGNAGMDVVALFVLPLAAFLAWAFLLIGSAFWPSKVAPNEVEPDRIIQAQSS